MIVNPIKGGSDPNNDYGPSFYLTLDLDSAKSWACKNNTIGVVNKYVVDNKKYEELKILDLTNKTKFRTPNGNPWLFNCRVGSQSKHNKTSNSLS